MSEVQVLGELFSGKTHLIIQNLQPSDDGNIAAAIVGLVGICVKF